MDELWQGLQKEAGHWAFWKPEWNWVLVKKAVSSHKGRLLPSNLTSNITPAQHSLNQSLLADEYEVSRKFCMMKNINDSFIICPSTGTEKRRKAERYFRW